MANKKFFFFMFMSARSDNSRIKSQTMKMRLTIIIVITALLAGCTNNDVMEDIELMPPLEKNEQPSFQEEDDGDTITNCRIILTSEQREALVKNLDFSFALLRQVNSSEEKQHKSFVLSPLSLVYSLGMLNTGSTGQTSKEITQLLGFGLNTIGLNELCKKLIQEAPMTDKTVSLQMANMVAVDKSLNLLGQYQQDIRFYYDAEIPWLNLGTREAVDSINRWCNRHTNGKIPFIVESLKGKLSLLNAIHFKAPWSYLFDASETHNDTFIREDGSQLMLPMMHGRTPAHYGEWESFSLLRLSYGNVGNWSMYVLLPHEGMSLNDILDKLTGVSWRSCIQPFERGGMLVDVKLPRFSASCDIELNEILQRMGATSMFEPRGELSRIAEQQKDLFVSAISQKALIEVDETGSQVAAVTNVELQVLAGPDMEQSIPFFHATRPFIYFIQEENSGAIFLAGVFR